MLLFGEQPLAESQNPIRQAAVDLRRSSIALLLDVQAQPVTAPFKAAVPVFGRFPVRPVRNPLARQECVFSGLAFLRLFAISNGFVDHAPRVEQVWARVSIAGAFA